VTGLAISTAAGVGLLVAASFLDGLAQGGMWVLALAVDAVPPYLFGTEGWKLEPRHFAERHGLIVIIALGESIVAIGAGAESRLDWGIAAAAIVGIALAAALWWMYFDVVALMSTRRLVNAEVGREQNALARDSYSYIHLLMVAGIILVALAMKKTLADVEEPLKTVPGFALTGGVAVFLLGLVCFRWRHIHTLNRHRFAYALILLAAFPLASELSALVTVTVVTVILWVMIAWETSGYGEGRSRVRHELAH
jgi:low temperature requirement protein LtrA